MDKEKIEGAVKIAIEQLEKKTRELKEELMEQQDLNKAILTLEQKAANLKQQLSDLSSIQIPRDLLEYYIQTNGHVWISKIVAIGNLRLNNCGRDLFYGSSAQSEFELPRGAYRLILMALPQKVKPDSHGEFCDDYGNRIRIEGDC